MKNVLSLIIGTAVCAMPALAANKGSINKIEHRERIRVRQGIRSGELTRAEARRLEARQARIRVDERFARADGTLTAKERERFRQELRHAGKNIYQQKHDNQDRD
jgi:hypothetical protein